MNAPLPALSRLGLGISGPHASFAVPKSKTRTLIREALGLGITYFDTAPAYGKGEAERRLGDALHTLRRERFVLSTKAGLHPGGLRDFSPGAIEMSLKGSLDRLQMKYVDVLFLHGPASSEINDRLMRRLMALRERGLFRHLGICGRGPELDVALQHEAIELVMAPVNALLPDTDRARLDRLKTAGRTIIGIETMAGTQRHSGPPTSLEAVWYRARQMKRAISLAPRARQSAMTPAEALQWALEQPVCDAALCLTTRRTNLSENAAAAGLEARGKIT